MGDGWIKISRRISEHWLFRDGERLKWWLDLLLMAQCNDHEWFDDGHRFTLRRGQMVASVKFLCSRWGRSKPTVLRFLGLLSKEGMISRRTLYRQTAIITICNYESYQAKEGGDVDTMVDPLVDPLVDTKQESKNIYKEISISPKVDMDTKKVSGRSILPFGDEGKKEGCAEEKRAPVPADQVMRMWNELCPSYPVARMMSESRRIKLRVRLEEMGKGGADALATLRTVFLKMEASSFLKGGNRRGWRAGLDWVLDNTNNWVKVYEGNYDNGSRGVRSGDRPDRRGHDVAEHAPEDYGKQF